MKQHSIILLPELTHIEQINQWRQRYDPLADKIAPHITLVFPFISNLTLEELQVHLLKVAQTISPFEIQLQGVTGTPDQYLFLNVKKGNDQIIYLHDQLYTEILARFLYRKVSYLPHITVGLFADSLAFEQALAETAEATQLFHGIVRKIYLEEIGPDDHSLIKYSVPLGKIG